MKKKVGLWIDHQKAVIVFVTGIEEEIKLIHSDIEEERIEGCVFMVATKDGPLSMCMHNAKRDEYILAPVTMKSAKGDKVWNPLTGDFDAVAEGTVFPMDPQFLPKKHQKGRVKKMLKEKQG